jgi:hypothetical protein
MLVCVLAQRTVLELLLFLYIDGFPFDYSAVYEVGVVHWYNCVAAAAVAVDLEGAVDVEGGVVKRYPLKILMQI